MTVGELRRKLTSLADDAKVSVAVFDSNENYVNVWSATSPARGSCSECSC